MIGNILSEKQWRHACREPWVCVRRSICRAIYLKEQGNNEELAVTFFVKDIFMQNAEIFVNKIPNLTDDKYAFNYTQHYRRF